MSAVDEAGAAVTALPNASRPSRLHGCFAGSQSACPPGWHGSCHSGTPTLAHPCRPAACPPSLRRRTQGLPTLVRASTPATNAKINIGTPCCQNKAEGEKKSEYGEAKISAKKKKRKERRKGDKQKMQVRCGRVVRPNYVCSGPAYLMRQSG